MSEYLGRAVLQVEADISDVTTKMAQAVSVTDAASRAMATNAGKAAEALSGIATKTNLDALDAKTNKAIDRFKALSVSLQATTGQAKLFQEAARGADASALAPWADAIDKIVAKTKEEAKAQDEVNRALRQRKAAQDALIGQLERQAATIGAKSPLEAIQLDANRLGVGAQAEKLIQQIQSASGSMRDARVNANQLRQAYAQLPAQITDVATSLASGAPAWLVLVQQGGQIKDSFGGIGSAFKALGNLITPMRLAFGGIAAAAGVVATAFYQAHTEGKAFRDAMTLTGRAAGITEGDFNRLAVSIGKSTRAGTSTAREALLELAAGGRVAGRALEATASAAASFAEATGESAKDTAKRFGAMIDDVAGGARKLNDQYHFLTAEQYAQIKAMEEAGDSQGALTITMRALDDQVRLSAQNLSPLESGWRSLTLAVGEYWEAIKRDFRPDTTDESVTALRNQIAATRAGNFDRATLPGLERELEVLTKAAFRERERVSAAAAYAEQQRANIKILDTQDKYLGKIQQRDKEIAAERALFKNAGRSDDDPQLLERIKQITEKYKEKTKATKESGDAMAYERGIAKEWADAYEGATKILDGATASTLKLTKGQESLLKFLSSPAFAQMPDVWRDMALRQYYAAIAAEQNETAIKETAKAYEDAVKSFDKYIEALTREADGAETAVAKMEADQEAAALAASARISLAEAIERVTISRLEEKLAINSPSPEAVDALTRELEARQKLLGMIQSDDVRKANAKAVDDQAKEFERLNDQIGQSLSDAIMDGGKSAAAYLRGLFRQLVLQPILRPLTAGIAGSIAAFTGGGAYAGQDGGGDTSIMGLANSYSTLAKAYEYYTGSGTGTLSAQYATWYNSLATSSVGQSLGLSTQAVAGNNASAYVASTQTAAGEAVGTMGQYAGYAAIGQVIGRGISGGYSAIGGNSGSTAVNVGTAIGSIWGPIGAAIGGIIGGVVNRAFGRKAPEVTERGIEGSFDASGFSGNAYQDILEKGGWFRSDKNYTVTSAINSDIDKALDEGAAKVRESVTKYTDALGLPAEQMGTVTEKFRIAVTDNEAENTKAVAEALGKYSNALVGAFAVDIEPLRRANETVADAIVRLGANLTGVNDVLTTLGATALQTSLQGADAASKLADVFGGLSGFTSATNAYYQEFFSQAEKSANLTRALGEAFTELGTSVPTTREEFKALVNAQDLMTESGRETFAALMSVSGAFDALQDSADQIAARRAELDIELLRAQGKETEALALERQKELEALRELDPALAQVKEMIYAAVDAAKEAEKWKNVWAGVDSVIGDFLGGEDLARYRAERIQDVLGGAGIDSSVEGIIGATKDDILALWEAVGVDGKQAILDAYGAWKLLQEELAQTEIDKIIDGLGVSADELLDAYREINPEADNLVEAWRKTKSEIEDLQTALDEFTGAAAKSAVDQLRADIAKRDQLRGVIDANNDTALNILAGRGTQEGVDALRRREAELWAEYTSTGNPEVAQAITRITLERIKLEGTVAQKSLQAQYDAKYQAELEAYELAKATITLEEAAREAQMDALREQIDAAERLKELAKNAWTFLGGLRAGTLSNLSYTDRLEQQRQLFQTSLVTGEGADQQLTAYLQQAQEMYGGATKTYSDIFTQALADYAAAVGDGAAGADQTIATAEAQLKALEKMAEQAPELEKAVIDTSQAEIDAISALNEVFGKNLDTLSKSIDGQIKVLQEQLEQLKLLKDSQESQITTYGKGVMEIKEKLDELVGPVKRIATTVETEAARA